jgi:hypothetical protein
MQARVTIELPPGTEGNLGVRAKLVAAVACHLGVDVHGHGDHGAIEKAEREPKRLRHRMPQTLVDRSAALYETMLGRMVDDIAKILAE